MTDERELEQVSDQLDSWAASPTDSVVRILPDLVSGCALTDDTVDVAQTLTDRLLVGAASK